MLMSTEETLRVTVTALAHRTGEQQSALAAALGLTQSQVSRRQSGKAAWTLTDCDRLAAHWGMPVLDLLAGPTHALAKLPADRIANAGQRTPAPLDLPKPAATPTPAPSEPENAAPPASKQAAAPTGPLADLVQERVEEELAAHKGDLATARAALIKTAVPDVMALFAASRVGGRYEHSEFPPTAAILKKASQKGADQIWEGRPKWRSEELHRAARAGHVTLNVTALDMNAAYLSALKTWLPIGKLVHSEGDYHDAKRSGVHRVTPAIWEEPDLPSPLGARKEPGDLWVTEPTLRLLLRCAKLGYCQAPVIHESWTSGASEGLLEKMRRTLAEVRKNAISKNDEVTLEYVKSMYSKFVSTIGESSANREIRRPDWMHTIRSQAFANLWLKAHKAHTSGLTVVQMSGTDELHVTGDWQSVFLEGRDLSQVKAKTTYTLGE
ncbi:MULTISPECIES: helix-turn-helix domain-containing protein [unclassified Streptomyces]|uniref:helix-turn-helix domain-containing protein n=1 Tax=unclassified Streptomyces TaxID=2593676 RepID=UPI002E146475|nr:helix-turn-helix domain-containing protein [Streptomyces sp. NBC_01197]WSR73121.1 helix-turn-helix domain-containing protein [Streptomyces sp. NBC_01197]WSS47173.1 helix-turn-helix domain-containing protein [Streptomyces sp. NBC_01180]